MTCVGVGGAEVARMKVRVFDGARVLAGAKELSDLIARRIPADFVESHRVATAVHLKRNLSTPDNRHFFRREMVDLVGARVRGAADGTCPESTAPGPGDQWAAHRNRRLHPATPGDGGRGHRSAPGPCRASSQRLSRGGNEGVPDRGLHAILLCEARSTCVVTSARQSKPKTTSSPPKAK